MKTVAVIFGGRSTEHDVSVITALASVIKPLELSKKVAVEAVFISKDGSWYWGDEFKDINLYQSGKLADALAKKPKAHLDLNGGFTLLKKTKVGGRLQRKHIDVVFPAMHGTHGEDGELMGILQMANVPFVGCGMAASSIAMDKVLSKLIVEQHGIPTPKMQFISKFEYEKNKKTFVKAVNAKLKYPVFVKPAHLGSSIGITRVSDKKDLENALEVALHYDNKVLVEESVPNLIEVTLPIMGNEEVTPALLEQPLLKADDFFDFETKYMQGGKKGKKGGKGARGAQGYSNLPADIPKALYEKAVTTGVSTYKAVGCEGIARIDMLINSKTKEVYFNEINPLPGSLYAHNWQQAGVSNVDLVVKLTELAQQRWEKQRQANTTFSTSYLKQF